MRNSSFNNLSSTSSSTSRATDPTLTIVSHWPVQDAVWILKLQVAKIFHLTGNPVITKTF
jgi:hypothetical protein